MDLGYIPFDMTDLNFLVPYFKLLFHPYEEDGIDFWWMDWQQGTQTKISGRKKQLMSCS